MVSRYSSIKDRMKKPQSETISFRVDEEFANEIVDDIELRGETLTDWLRAAARDRIAASRESGSSNG